MWQQLWGQRQGIQHCVQSPSQSFVKVWGVVSVGAAWIGVGYGKMRREEWETVDHVFEEFFCKYE